MTSTTINHKGEVQTAVRPVIPLDCDSRRGSIVPSKLKVMKADAGWMRDAEWGGGSEENLGDAITSVRRPPHHPPSTTVDSIRNFYPVI